MQKVCERLEAFGLSRLALRSMRSAPSLENLGLAPSSRGFLGLGPSSEARVAAVSSSFAGFVVASPTENAIKLVTKGCMGSCCARACSQPPMWSQDAHNELASRTVSMLDSLLTPTPLSHTCTESLSLTLQPLLQTTSRHVAPAPNVRARDQGSSLGMVSGSTRTLPRRRCWLLGLSDCSQATS